MKKKTHTLYKIYFENAYEESRDDGDEAVLTLHYLQCNDQAFP